VKAYPWADSSFSAYVAPLGFVPELRKELGRPLAEFGRLLIAEGPPRPVAWAENIWCDPVVLEIESIGAGARALRLMQRSWAHFPISHHRRASLLTDKLPHVGAKPLEFGAAVPGSPLGSWGLLDATTMIAAPTCTSAFPNGELRFVEDRESAPSRAYLKAWEAITLLGRRPEAGERAIDLGSSPGGWTWVLASLGLSVISVDKAPLATSVAADPLVRYESVSAFSIDPKDLEPLDWLFCDIACYPERLLGMVRRWLEAGTCPRFVCTLKFQGETDHETARQFAALPHSRLVHLHHNKHELTWIHLPQGEALPLVPGA
jgi:23S rRNA (cytidine2498-2'-O)-methyltransferase